MSIEYAKLERNFQSNTNKKINKMNAKVYEIVEKMQQLKKKAKVEHTNEQDFEYADFKIASKHFPTLRNAIQEVNKNLDFDLSTLIAHLLLSDIKFSEWRTIKNLIEGNKDLKK